MCFECSAIVSNLLHSRPMWHDAGTSFTNCYVTRWWPHIWNRCDISTSTCPGTWQHPMTPFVWSAPPPFFLICLFFTLDTPWGNTWRSLFTISWTTITFHCSSVAREHPSPTAPPVSYTYLSPPPPHLKTLLPSGFYVYCWMWCTWKAFVWVRDKMSKKPPLKCSNTVHGRIFILRFLKLFVSYRGVWFKAKRVLEL